MGNQEKKITRRDFFKSTMRNIFIAGITIGGCSLYIKHKQNINQGNKICTDCSVYSFCILPEAIRSKKYLSKNKTSMDKQ